MKTTIKLYITAILSLLALIAGAQTPHTSIQIDNETMSNYHLVGSLQSSAAYEGQANETTDKVVLNWSVDATEKMDRFEVEKSFDGRNFITAGLVFAPEKTGKEDFAFYEKVGDRDKIFYRIKMYNNNQSANYSRILAFEKPVKKSNEIKILNNPVADKLSFAFQSADTHPVLVRIADMNGRVQLSKVVSSTQGSNMMTVPNTALFNPGTYVIEILKGNERHIAKFVKQ